MTSIQMTASFTVSSYRHVTCSPKATGGLAGNQPAVLIGGNRMQIVLIADCRRLAAQIRLALVHMNAVVEVLVNVADAREAIEVHDYDLLIADLDHTPDLSIEMLKLKSSRWSGLRTLALGSRDAIAALKTAIDLGVDDFLFKPFDPAELQLRVGCLSPLSAPGATAVQRLVHSYGPLTVDQSTRSVWLDAKLVELTPRERGVLNALMRHRGQVVSKEQIAEKISSVDNCADPTAIETYVYRLRRKLAHRGIEIRTIRGLGYVLELGSD